MKIIIKSVSVATLIVFASSLMTACSTVTSSGVYQGWQQKAYGAYRVPVPEEHYTQSSVIFDANEEQQTMVYLPERGVVSQPKVPVERISDKEKKYISQYYGL